MNFEKEKAKFDEVPAMNALIPSTVRRTLAATVWPLRQRRDLDAADQLLRDARGD